MPKQSLLSGLFLPLISPSLWTYCPFLSFLPDPHFSFPVDPPGWFLPYSHPPIPSGFPFTDSRPTLYYEAFHSWEWGRERGEGLQLFQMLCCCEYFPYCACLKFSLYRWQNEMCHLIISPTCTAGNLSSKQSAVTIWFSEYQRLSENWAEGKEENRIEHFGFCKFLFFFSFFFSPQKYHFPWKVVTSPNDSIMSRFTGKLLSWPLQPFFTSKFVVLDFLVYLINHFNNSNQHKHAISLVRRVFSLLAEHCCCSF